ncbi:MAG: tetratricopeptide repeat protein, partial [Fimbriimonadales bacterium]|nr:tetratricopeptide repeat protein [Fimbriimonadales bacterium]
RVVVRHLGCYRLSERGSNEQVYQLDFVGRAQQFAPLRAFSPLRKRLVRVPTSFIGREVELTQLQAWLQAEQGGLITIVGAPGVGKSRLALELAWRVEPLFGEARWWVVLHSRGDSVAEALARWLGWEGRGLEPFIHTLRTALSEQPALLVVDTTERLSEGQIAEVMQLLEGIPQLHIVVAAQLPLEIPGERLFWLEPLPLPPETADTPEALLRYASVRLFVERARQALPDFRLTASNAVEIGTLCRLLEGLPLAIELAAARVGSLPVAEISERLRHSIEWLGRRPAGALGHSLLTSLATTCRLLSAEVAAFLARLSVFRGEFTLEAAQAVASPPNASDALQELTRVSLVQSDGERYRLLEPVRLFAEGQLRALGEMERVRAAHLDYYLMLAEQLGDKMGSWEVLEAERANLEVALASGLAQAPEKALQLVSVLAPFWEGRGSGQGAYELVCQLPERLSEVAHRLQAARIAISLAVRRGEMDRAGTLLERYLPVAEQHPDLLAAARLWVVAGFYYWMRGEGKQSVDYLQRAVERFAPDEAPLDRAEALIHLGVARWIHEELQEATYLFQEALELLPPEAAPRLRLNALGNLANILYQRGHYEQAEACLKETLQLAQRLGDQRTVATLLNNWGVWLRDRGEYAKARELYMQSHAIWQALHEGMGATITLNNLGDLAMLEGDHETAHRMFVQSIQMAHQYQLGWFLYSPLRNLAELAARRGDLDTAYRWMLHALHSSLQHHPIERTIPLMNELARYAMQQGEVQEAARWLLLAARWTPDPEQAKGLLNTVADYLTPTQRERLQQEVNSLSVETLVAQLESLMEQETAGAEPF